MSTDVRMNTEVIDSTGFPAWDFYIDDSGQAPFIEGSMGDEQAAGLATFIDFDSSPQLVGVGVPWSSYLVNEATFGEVDSAIRTNLSNLDLNFQPDYSVKNNKVTCTVVKR